MLVRRVLPRVGSTLTEPILDILNRYLTESYKEEYKPVEIRSLCNVFRIFHKGGAEKEGFVAKIQQLS